MYYHRCVEVYLSPDLAHLYLKIVHPLEYSDEPELVHRLEDHPQLAVTHVGTQAVEQCVEGMLVAAVRLEITVYDGEFFSAGQQLSRLMKYLQIALLSVLFHNSLSSSNQQVPGKVGWLCSQIIKILGSFLRSETRDAALS